MYSEIYNKNIKVVNSSNDILHIRNSCIILANINPISDAHRLADTQDINPN